MKIIRTKLKWVLNPIILLLFICFIFAIFNDQITSRHFILILGTFVFYLFFTFQIKLWSINTNNYNSLITKQVNKQSIKITLKEIFLIFVNTHFLINSIAYKFNLNISFSFEIFIIQLLTSCSVLFYILIKIEMFKFYLIREMILSIILKIFKLFMKVLECISFFLRKLFLLIRQLFLETKNQFTLKWRIKIGWQKYLIQLKNKFYITKIAFEDTY
ncbi:hypothetical protein [Spiroplasma cantharicola]|uniref:Uncharacterized protein n=1 Tax=Spiroplasma cantharicola TaxID=362837 RepID=A0A0M4K1H9_9MOLU|nr:hypothetical protein [Spiroplasma cantharicola]ALD66462.1 hypothetical protein SCANT_v1c05560 [Spiroplasma cantharicola]